jgi:hypothetical protein
MGLPSQLGSGQRPTLRDRLLCFYAANPDETLTLADIESKFGYARNTVKASVMHMRRAELLAKVETGKKTAPSVLSAGPALLEMIGVTK